MIARTASSHTARFSANARPKGSSSVLLALSPMPNSTRPRLTRSRHGDALGDPRRRARRQLHDAVGQADLPGALARRAEKHLGGRRMRVLLEKVMLDFPGEVVAEPVGQLDLVERVLVEPQFAVRLPRARQLQLVKNAEPHRFLSRPNPATASQRGRLG